MHCETPFIQKQAARMLVEARMSSSNEILPEHDSKIVRDLITEVVGELGSVDADIWHLETILSNLQNRRQVLQSRLERLRSGAHRKVPPEILAKVFRYCHDEAIQLPPQYAQDIWSITQVCSKWREVAIADPRLWNRLSIETSHEQDFGLTCLIDEILRNRGGEGRVSYKVDINNQQGWQETLNLTYSYRSRIRKLEIHFLSTLNLDDFQIEASCGRHSTQLQSNIRITSPWTHLTDICIFRITIPMFSLILRHSIQLVNCRVMVTKDHTIQDISEGPIRLELLQTLDIMQMFCSGFSVFLARLVLPRLKAFKVGCLQDWPQAGMMKMLEQSSCSLEIFETTYHVPPAVLPTLMSAMPDLTTLKVYLRSPITESILNEIRVNNLAPKLRKLEGWEIQSLPPFVDLLRSRWTGPGEGICDAIVRIHVKFLAPDEKYLRDILPELKRDGRRINRPVSPYELGIVIGLTKAAIIDTCIGVEV